MKRFFLYLILLIFTLQSIFAQSPAKYWIQFKDKQGTPYTINKPEAFLSPKALERRAKYNIKITEQDLPVSPVYIQKVLELDSTMVLFTKSKWLNGITVYSEKENIMDEIKKLDFVIFVEKTIPMKEVEDKISEVYHYNNANPPITSTGIPKDIDYGLSYAQIKINNIHWLHRMGFNGEGINLMVLDGGFQNIDNIAQFAFLREQNRLREVRHIVSPSADPFRAGSHGTMVLSCIASYVPGELVGTAPGVNVWMAQTEDGRSENKVEEDNWVAGVEWADSLGCYVINSSLGYTKFDDSTQVRKTQDLNSKVSRASIAASYIASKGMILCNSAGNEGEKPWHYIGCPADATDILTVGGVNIYGKRATFSSYGPTADGRIKPDAVTVGREAYVANPRAVPIRADGTSFSSPLLSGMVACLWQAFPQKNAYEIMDAIRKSGDRAAEPDSSLGYGITDFLKAYNILNQTSEITQLKVDFKTYVVSENKVMVTFTVSDPKEIQITTSLRNFPNKLKVKKLKLKLGTNEIVIKTSKLKKNQKYDFIDFKIQETNTSQSIQYVLGIEKSEKK
jgi:serine protease AprX